jgi:hypothetical protein
MGEVSIRERAEIVAGQMTALFTHDVIVIERAIREAVEACAYALEKRAAGCMACAEDRSVEAGVLHVAANFIRTKELL